MDKIPVETLEDDPAFAAVESGGYYLATGLTKREYFAAHALAGIVANPEFIENFNDTAKVCAEQAVLMAESLIKKLNE